MLKAKIRRLEADVKLPEYGTAESAGFDIAVNSDVSIAPGKTALVPTGLVVESPPGHFLLLAARSSLGLKKGLKLVNGVGIVDRDYAGPNDEIFLALHNFTSGEVSVKKGERLAQGIFVKCDPVEWEEVLEMRDKSRGGYGSTGGYKT